ncbi:APC family permease [Gordonia sp. DT30]|uniref:APC family permease n=1 Tax=unclassified Gordonia (in: high G+C Gram-positive bacteria) TaxID=2657482 RepID=UPI003CECEDD4
MHVNALQSALVRARFAGAPAQTVRSPLSALGRRQLTQSDLIGQSMSTMAPATGMVFIAQAMSGANAGPTGLVAILAATAVMTLVALCVRQFTMRLAASGSLYSFIAHGMPKPIALTAGAALLTGYVVMTISVSNNAGHDIVNMAAMSGLDLPAGMWFVACAVVVIVCAAVAIGGVRSATRIILAIELCTVSTIAVLLLLTPGHPTAGPHLDTPVSFGVFMVCQVVLSLAGFESAAFFGPEAERQLHTVSRAVVVTPILTGALFILAGWAGMTGQATTLINAYFYGTTSGVGVPIVVAVHLGVWCSWAASTLGFIQAGSRLLFSMSVEGVVPRFLGPVNQRFRTPAPAVVAFAAAAAIGAVWFRPGEPGSNFEVLLDVAWVLGYVLVAVAALVFLRRIGEHTARTLATCVLSIGAGTAFAVFTVIDGLRHGNVMFLAWSLLLGISGCIWYLVLRRFRPDRLASIGVFDSVETADLLPGSAILRTDEQGRPVLVATGSRLW